MRPSLWSTRARSPLALTVALFAALTGCDHDHDDDHAHGADAATEDPIEVGCAHLEFGPDVDLTLADDPAPISAVHTRYRLTLSDEGDSYGGALGFTSTGSDYYFLLDKASGFAVTDAGGAAVEAMHAHMDPAACAVAAVAYHYMLPAGDYTLTFGPTDDDRVDLAVHVPMADHGHAHE